MLGARSRWRWVRPQRAPASGDSTKAARPPRQGPASAARPAGEGRPGGDHGRGWRRRHHPLARQRDRDRPDPGHRHARGPPPGAQSPFDQPFGPEARAFARGRSPPPPSVELLRSPDARPLRPDAGLSVHQWAELLGAGHQGPATRPRRSATTATMACPTKPPRSWPPPRPSVRCPSSRRISTGPDARPDRTG